MVDEPDDVEGRYKDLVATCWTIFANEHAAAARISMRFEAHPEFALRKLRERPEFFGPLREGSLLEPGDQAYATTALTIREKVRDFKEAVEAQVDNDREQEQERQRKRRRERER